MIDHGIVSLALRTRALSLVVCTTGSVSLSATAVGYARAAGSFVTDGFVVGQELTPTGFTQTAPGLVTAVSALLLTIHGGRTVQAVGAGRTLSVGLPAFQVYDNSRYTRTINRWYVEGEYSPSTANLSTVTASRGYGEETGEYYWKLYGIEGMGESALLALATKVLACYAPGDGQTLSDGNVLRIDHRPGPKAGTIMPDAPGYSVLTVTVPWRCSFTNPVL